MCSNWKTNQHVLVPPFAKQFRPLFFFLVRICTSHTKLLLWMIISRHISLRDLYLLPGFEVPAADDEIGCFHNWKYLVGVFARELKSRHSIFANQYQLRHDTEYGVLLGMLLLNLEAIGWKYDVGYKYCLNSAHSHSFLYWHKLLNKLGLRSVSVALLVS